MNPARNRFSAVCRSVHYGVSEDCSCGAGCMRTEEYGLSNLRTLGSPALANVPFIQSRIYLSSSLKTVILAQVSFQRTDFSMG